MWALVLYRPAGDSPEPSGDRATLVRLKLGPMYAAGVMGACQSGCATSVANKNFHIVPNYLADPSFRWGAGALLSSGRLSIIATERCIPPWGHLFACASILTGVDYTIIDQ
jgi:hypothetical protein